MGFFDWFKCRRCKDLEARLFAEIDSNRLREDEQSRIIAQLAGARILPGGRTQLAPGLAQAAPQEIDVEAKKDEPLDAETEGYIKLRVEEIVEQGREHGWYQTQAEIDQLEAKIRADTRRYL